MPLHSTSAKPSISPIFYRITALWVICEAFAGGIMHGFKIPFSGMIVSSLAVCCIILLAHQAPSRTAILKATIIVAIFKLMLSPHSPPTAYVAVFFQGALGQLLFFSNRFFTISAILLAVLALVESAIQRLLVLMILYGSDFWQAVNEFIGKITGDKTINNYSLGVAGAYVAIHALAGLVIGYYAARLIRKSGNWRTELSQYLITRKHYEDEPLISKTKIKRKKIKWIFLIGWLLLLAFYIQSVIDPSGAVLPKGKLLDMITRSVLVVVAWYLFVSPLIMAALRKAIISRQAPNKEYMNQTMQLLPEMKIIFRRSWQYSAIEKGRKRFRLFAKILLMNVLEGGQ